MLSCALGTANGRNNVMLWRHDSVHRTLVLLHTLSRRNIQKHESAENVPNVKQRTPLLALTFASNFLQPSGDDA